MDTIPEALYQDILSYLIGDSAYFHSIFFEKHYSLQFINKTFQRSFIHYLKTKPLRLYITNTKTWVKSTLQVFQWMKRYDIHVYELIICLYDGRHGRDDYCPAPLIMEAMYGINFTSLRRLELKSVRHHFDFKILEDCKELTHFAFGLSYSHTLKDERIAEELKTFLSFKKDSLEYLKFPVNDNETYNYIFPEDLSWPNMKKLTVTQIDVSRSKRIESSTLQHLLLEGFKYVRSDSEILIKCPNLKVLLINYRHTYNHEIDEIELNDRSSKPYDEKGCFSYTCHPSELRKIGLVVDVGSDCDVGIRIYKS